MVCTSDEAKSKWCPYTKIVAVGYKYDNRGFKCLGTGCMEWKGDEDRGFCNMKRIQT